MISYEFCNIFKNIFFREHLWGAASELIIIFPYLVHKQHYLCKVKSCFTVCFTFQFMSNLRNLAKWLHAWTYTLHLSREYFMIVRMTKTDIYFYKKVQLFNVYISRTKMIWTLVLNSLERKISSLQNALILGAPLSRDITIGGFAPYKPDLGHLWSSKVWCWKAKML